MFKITDKLTDDYEDDILSLLKKLLRRNSWNSEAKKLLSELEDLLIKNNYKSLSGSPNRYHLSRVGESCLYDVPLYKRGFLKEYRGKRVRIVCVGSGRFSRTYMTKAIGITPPEKLITKRVFKYVFPEIGDHEIKYLGRRYMLISSMGNTPIRPYQGSFEEIDLESCNFILLDGKLCCPIAKFIQNENGTITGKLISWQHWHEDFASIPEAINGILKVRHMWEMKF